MAVERELTTSDLAGAADQRPRRRGGPSRMPPTSATVDGAAQVSTAHATADETREPLLAVRPDRAVHDALAGDSGCLRRRAATVGRAGRRSRRRPDAATRGGLRRGTRAARGAVGAGRRRLDRGSARRAPAVSLVLRPPARHVEPAPGAAGQRPEIRPGRPSRRRRGAWHRSPHGVASRACRSSSRSTAARRSPGRSGSAASRGRVVATRRGRQPGLRRRLGDGRHDRRAASSSPREVSPNPHPREHDMLLTAGERISIALLSMAINDLGREAVSFTGSQAGILTDTTHGKARIVEMRSRPRARGARRRPDRDRRRLPGRLLRRGRDDARPRRLRHDRRRARRRPRRRRLRDLHRRRRRLHRRPAHRPRRAQARHRHVRGDARPRRVRREGADAPRGRVRSEPWSAAARSLVVHRGRGHVRRERARVARERDHLRNRPRHVARRKRRSSACPTRPGSRHASSVRSPTPA